ncbi:hypothetical protein NM208_g6652 [Fusarium decemcellulare]|uniref:Uncharacterized protein n=1 Tax=Fusarium decemcellulare TaxID=57161 RepID=A0ACC1SCE6_9HYPO|nr:hypothetical protein NM208_g6652 [Fusarium decemcellulare]
MAKKLNPTQFTKAVMRSFMADSGLEPRLLGKHFRVLSAAEGRVDFELDIHKDHTNRLQTIHGGTIASWYPRPERRVMGMLGCESPGFTTRE